MPRCVPVMLIGILALTTLVASGGAPSVMAQEATPAAGAELIAAYEAAFNAHDADAVAALYAEDATVTQAVQDGSVFQGREEIRGWIADNLGAIPDLTLSTVAVISEGDSVAWSWVYEGTYTGQFPGMPAGQGQPIELHGAGFLELRDGLIAQETVYYDTLAFLTQTGALGTPAAGEEETAAVTIRLFSCPANLAQEEPDQTALMAACAPFDSPDLAPTLHPLPDGEPIAGTMTEPGVYRWEDLALGGYAMSAENPAEMTALLVTDAAGSPLQNPVALLDAAGTDAAYSFFYFVD